MKPNLILLHGALGSKDQFIPIQKTLDENFTTWVFNFEGHGGNETNKDFTIALFEDNLIQFIRKNKIENVNVFGYSMGGYIALKTAIDHPKLFNKIMTYGTKFRWDAASAEKEIKMMNPEVIEMKVPAFAEALKKKHHPSDWKALMLKTADMMKELGNSSALDVSTFSKIENEVLISVGSADKMVSIEESEKIANAIPMARLLVLKDSQHPIESIDAKVLKAVILEFMN